MYLQLPKYVKQKTTWSCWAAGGESFFALQSYGRKPTQQELIDEYATHGNGGLEPTSAQGGNRSFETLCGDFGLSYEVHRGRDFTADMVKTRLQRSGHVLLVYRIARGVAHANVVYGVGAPDGGGTKISVMDPSVAELDPKTGYYRNRPVGFYGQRDLVLMAWMD